MYDDVDKCVKCGCKNIVTEKDTDAGTLCEAETLCTAISCKHEDYWAYGFFQSKGEKP